MKKIMINKRQSKNKIKYQLITAIKNIIILVSFKNNFILFNFNHI